MTPTTRRYPRSLADAFPSDRANAITHYRRPRRVGPWLVILVCIVIVGVLK